MLLAVVVACAAEEPAPAKHPRPRSHGRARGGSAESTGPCPEEMALVEDRFCIDRWEESLVELTAEGEKPFPPYQSPDGAPATVRAVSDMINVSYVRQKEALGLGHAVLRARELVGDQPFAVILSDDVIDAEVPALRQLLDVYEFYGAPVLALMEVPRESISAYGVVDAEPVGHNGGRDRLYRIRNLVEKPKAEDAPSNLAIIGRYVLTPEVFRSLETIEPGSGGELQLTDGLKHALRSRPIYGYRFEGTRYDAGDKLGFLKATVEFALKRHDLGEPFRAYLKSLQL